MAFRKRPGDRKDLDPATLKPARLSVQLEVTREDLDRSPFEEALRADLQAAIDNDNRGERP